LPECPHCSKEIEAGSAFCQRCGQKIDEAAPPAREAAAAAPFRSELKLGEYLKTGWQVFRQFPWGFVLFALIYFIVLAIISYPRGIGWLAAAAIHEPLVAGFIIVSAKILQEKTPTFGDFFGGFQFRYFLPLVLLGVVSRVLITIGLILLVIPGLYLAVSYIFATLMVVDQRLDFWPAMEQSRKTVTPRWFSFFVFLLLLVLVNIAGILALGVGLLVSLPVSWCALVAAYADLFGLKSKYDQVP
jgi:uncharacterized membrane protein